MDETSLRYGPPGWGYNPSGWGQRLPIVWLALVGFGVALHLALHQWRVFDTVWGPSFGEGSRRILNSGVSRLLRAVEVREDGTTPRPATAPHAHGSRV